MGPGKTKYTFSVMFRFPLRPFSVLPAGGGGWVRRGWVGQAGVGGSGGETESTLALAENVYVKVSKKSFHSKFSVAELLKLGKKSSVFC
jgi:hypothetical protein